MEAPQHISELNSAIAFLTLKTAIALFSSELCGGASKPTSHPQTMICLCMAFVHNRLVSTKNCQIFSKAFPSTFCGNSESLLFCLHDGTAHSMEIKQSCKQSMKQFETDRSVWECTGSVKLCMDMRVQRRHASIRVTARRVGAHTE